MAKPPTAVVTGASSGLGLELALQLTKDGYHVLGVARHPPSDSRWTELERAGTAEFIAGDVQISETAERAVSRATEVGNYKLLVNCAGQGVFGPAAGYSGDDILNVLAGNLVGVIQFCVRSIAVFASTGGTIVNVMSTAAHVGRSNETIYCASKWGARGYTEALRVELKGKPIRIVAVYPGGMKTPFWQKSSGHNVNADSFMDPSEVASELAAALRLKRTLQVTDIFLNRA